MANRGKRADRDNFPKNHPVLNSVNPEHLAFAFHVATGVRTQHMRGVNPTEKVISLEMKPGQVSDITFTDNPFNRMMLTVTKELSAFYPTDDPESFQATSAIMFRILAMPKMLGRDGVSELIEKNPDGEFSLGPKTVIAFATAPLSTHGATYKKKAFSKHLMQVSVPDEYSNLRINIPGQLIEDTEDTESGS
jgi:hypothetical protein